MALENGLAFLEIEDPGWQEFVSAIPDANIFHSPAWSKVLAETYRLTPKVMALLGRDNEIISALPFLEKRQVFGGREWLALPFTDHCEVLSKNDQAVEELAAGMQQALIDSDLKELEVRGDLPGSAWQQISEKHVLHKLHLEEDVEQVWKNLHSMHRRNIRHARKKELRVQWGKTLDDMKAFYRIHLDTRSRKGVPIQPWSFFSNLHRNMIERDLGSVVLVYDGDECVAGGIFLHWGETLTYKYGASTIKAQSSRANNLMMWSAIEWGCEQGYRILDLGRSDLSNKGLRKYKSRYGAEEVPLVYSNSSPQADEPISEKVMKFGSPILQRLPKWFTRVSGELVYRLFI